MDYQRLQPLQPEAAARPTVLVVDDQQDLRDAIAVLLEVEGYDVVEAGDGREALQHLLRSGRHIAAIVLDLAMPVMDGWQFLAEYRTRAELREIPVIVVTGVSDARRRRRELGDIAVFIKPFHFDELIREIQRSVQEGTRCTPTALEF